MQRRVRRPAFVDEGVRARHVTVEQLCPVRASGDAHLDLRMHSAVLELVALQPELLLPRRYELLAALDLNVDLRDVW